MKTHMSPETLQYIIKAFNACSDDITRQHINFIKVVNFGDRIEITATDGRMLSCVEVVDAEFAKVLKGAQYIHRDALPALKLLLKTYKSNGVPVEQLEGKNIRIGNGTSVESERDVTFPDTSHLKPTYPEDALTIGLNAELLFELAKALADESRSKSSRYQIKLTIKDKGSPILVEVGDNAEGLLMPVRL